MSMDTERHLTTFFFLTNDSDPSTIMRSAFVSIKNKKFPLKWINFEKLKTENFINDIIVFDKFEGPEFDYFQRKHIRIISPYVIKYCDKDICSNPFTEIPFRSWPIYSQCMRGLEVTCSNLPIEKKKQIEKKVLLMSGSYHLKLHSSTSFLVSDSVLTLKCRVAGQYRIPIMNPDWIEACWETHQTKLLRANDPSIVCQYRLKIFHGISIVTSGFENEERNEIKRIVEANGATYSPALQLKPLIPNMILILREKKGEKYKYAKLKNIYCLRIDWIHDSIESGYALPFEDYDIETKANVDKRENTSPNFVKNENSTKSIQTPAPTIIRKNSKYLSHTIDGLGSDIKDQFLEDHIIHAVGFDKLTLESIQKNVKLCGAFYYNDLKPLVTEVIIGTEIFNDKFKNILDNFGDRLVTVNWLLDCLKFKKLCPHINYRVNSLSQLISSTENIEQNLKNIYNNEMPATVNNKNQLITNTSNKSSPMKPFNVLTDDPDEVCKRIMSDWKLPENVKSDNDMHPSQNCKPLINDLIDEEEDSPPVSWSPREDEIPFESQNLQSIKDVTKRIFSNDDVFNVKKYRKDVSCSTNISNQTMNNSTEDSNCDSEEYSNELSSIDVEELIKPKTPMLMFSGFDPELKIQLFQKVQDVLKVSIRDDPLVSDEVTHFILREPCATEKVLAIIAAGISILKPEFIMKSLKEGKLEEESQYQWGLEFIDQQPHKSHARIRLMISALEWKRHLDKIKKKLFEDYKFLFLNNTKQSTMLTACGNILRAGGAEVYSIDDFQDRENELDSLLPEIQYALVDFQAKQKPLMTKTKFFKYVEYFDFNDRIMSYQIISRYIIDGPGASLENLKRKIPINLTDIRNSLSQLY